MSVSANTLAAEPGYYNHDPMVWLIDCTNEAAVVVKGVEMMPLVDTGSQISAHTEGFCTEFGLRILPLKGLLHLKGQGMFKYCTKDTYRLTSLFQVYPGIMKMCNF